MCNLRAFREAFQFIAGASFLLLKRRLLTTGLLATPPGLEPGLSAVTERRFDQLNYGAICMVSHGVATSNGGVIASSPPRESGDIGGI